MELFPTYSLCLEISLRRLSFGALLAPRGLAQFEVAAR